MKDGEIGSGHWPRIGRVEQTEEISTWTKLDGLLREQARVMAAIINQVRTLAGLSQDSDPGTDPATDTCQGPAFDAAHPRQILAYVQMAQDLLLDAREHLVEFDQEHRDQSITVAHYTAKADRLEIQNTTFRRKLRERNAEIRSINRTRKTGNLELGRARRTVEELHRYCHDLLRFGTESTSAGSRAEHDHGRFNRAI